MTLKIVPPSEPLAATVALIPWVLNVMAPRILVVRHPDMPIHISLLGCGESTWRRSFASWAADGGAVGFLVLSESGSLVSVFDLSRARERRTRFT
jgi:hypothetical protein